MKKQPCGPVRPSRRGRWRALTLVLVHVAAGLHVLHWYVTGKTITPVEPSEAMQTLGEGLVNAGFILFILLILSTLIFGRFFCGWGCHIVALQDLCTWFLRKIGIRPRPFRSRLLIFVPLAAAIWMFVAPSVVRAWIGQPPPEFVPHFETYYFWERFPELFVALLTFAVCGFVIVYLLGNKGFCTYGCPYGGVFGLADQVAPGKIRVTDACDGCGHCTVSCTSNVQVAEEVRVYGMVVDPGCMKCMDCTSVCPRDALYFGFGKPAVRKKERAAPRRRRYDYSWSEELALAGFFLASIVILRALYDKVPFLLALGLASISAYVMLTAARLFYKQDVTFTRFRLRAGGRLTGRGTVYLVLVAVWTVFLAHSGWVQYLRVQGERHLFAGAAKMSESEAGATQVRQGIEMLIDAERAGLVVPVNLLSRIASGYVHVGDTDRAVEYYGRAVEQAPEYAAAHFELARLLLLRGDKAGAVEQLLAVVDKRPEYPGAYELLADLLVGLDRGDEALSVGAELRRERPEELPIRMTYGVVLAQIGQTDRALTEIRAVIDETPRDPVARFHLGQVLGRAGRFDEAVIAFERAVALAPGYREARYNLAKAAARLERWDVVREQMEALLPGEPYNAEYLRPWAHAIARTGRLEDAIATAERAGEHARAIRYRLVFLYLAAGRGGDARRIADEFPDVN